MKFRFTRFFLGTLALVSSLGISSAKAGDLYNDADARSAALGGEAAGASGDLLAAMQANPAALSSLDRPELTVNLTGALLAGHFDQNSRNSGLRDGGGFLADGAIEIPAPRQWPLRFGLAVVPDLTLQSSWRYLDQPGGLGGATSYGVADYHSRLLSLRTTAAVAWQVTPWLSLGGSAGFVYAQDQLKAPYIFQSQPVLAGFKTLLDLDADGFAPAFALGLQVHPLPALTLGLNYQPRVVVGATGRATGNAEAQLLALGGGFALANPIFGYDVNVRTELPQRINAGAEWELAKNVRLVAGIDWINWADAFDQLQIHLSNGNNADINAVAGSSSLYDVVPLRWRDQFVYRAGFEFAFAPEFVARLGYSYGRSPVPNDTLTPLTAAIFEHTISSGLGFHHGRYHADFAYQWRLPAAQHVDQSILLDGEYSHSSTTVSAQVFQLTTGVEF